MDEFQWSIGTDLPERDVRVVSEGVLADGRALAAAGDARPLACLVRQQGRVVAGGAARTEYGRLFVQSLWVDEPLRSRGLGSAILQKLEAQARSAGCTSSLLETLSDRAAAFYRRLGYASIAQLPGYVGPFTRHILLKVL